MGVDVGNYQEVGLGSQEQLGRRQRKPPRLRIQDWQQRRHKGQLRCETEENEDSRPEVKMFSVRHRELQEGREMCIGGMQETVGDFNTAQHGLILSCAL